MRVRRYLLKKVEKELNNVLSSPVWVIKKGRYYYIQDVATGEISFHKYKNLAEIVEGANLVFNLVD